MSEAFKCDKCGEYKDGQPTKLQVEKEDFGYNTILYYEMCSECKNKICKTIRGMVEG